MENNTTDNSLVSIIMPAHNAGKHISEAINSIISQTYSNWELIVVDDCSKDNTYEIIEQFAIAEKRIHIVHMSQNVGPGVCRNKGIELAQGRYISFLDSDDKWLPTKLEKELNHMKKMNCAVVYSSYFICDEQGKVNGWVKCRKKETEFSIKCDDKMGNLTFMYDETITGKIYMPTIRKRQDWVHKMNIMSVCKVAYGVQEPLAIYRHSDSSISRHKMRLIKYNIAGYQQLGWTKAEAMLFFTFIFAPTYILKRVRTYIHSHEYKKYMN